MLRNRSVLNRPMLAITTSVLALVSATCAFAQDTTTTSDNMETVVVTGSRSAPRAVLDTLAPVDVIAPAQIAHTGTTDLAQALSQALPSLNFTHPAITDGTDSLRPATLRGMSPDQTLVLINSKRAHTSALVNLNGSLGYGAAAMDLNTIPAAALGNVEVLRDGASAQYGSDAIAGVLNLRLKEASSGGGVTVTAGYYDTNVGYNLGGAPTPPAGVTLPNSRHLQDGATVVVSGWKGFDLGNGFVTITAEYKDQQHTTRAGPDPRAQYTAAGTDPRELTFNRFDNWYGDPKMQQYTGYLNAGYDLSDDVHLYAFGGYQYRNALSAANWRRPLQQTSNPASNLVAVYPNGFLPKIGSKIEDATMTVGVKGVAQGWNWDTSFTYGYNAYHFDTVDSINVSLGPTSPTHFYAGGPRYGQGVFNLDVNRPISLFGREGDTTLAAGGEVRFENYNISAGQPESYSYGGYVTPSGTIGGSGAQGFPGFAPSDAVTANRNSQSIYVDVETKPVEALDVDFAGRFENYSDFGTTVNGKIAARYDFNDMFAIRGAVSSGFRAPSLQQEYVSYTSTTFIGGVATNSTVLRASNPVAQYIGAVPLRPENSINYSIGGVFRWENFSTTLDAYSISVGNRIALSDNLTQANVQALFPASAQIGAARFYTNGVDTITQGVELVSTYHWIPEADIGNFNFSFSASHNETNIRALRSTPQLSALTPAPAFLTNYRVQSLTEGQPKWKATLATDWTYDWFGATATANYYGPLLQPFNGNVPAADYKMNGKILFDLETRADVGHGLQLALGAQNLFDTYPTTPPYILAGQSISTNGVGQFPEYSPFGFDGRYVYLRVGYHL